jgi:hypothetical protein
LQPSASGQEFRAILGKGSAAKVVRSLSLIGQSGTGQLSVNQLIAMVLLPMAIPLIAIVVSASSFAVRNRGKNG